MTTVINLSALAEAKADTSIPATILGMLDGNLALQWLSIREFAKLHAKYAPPTIISAVVCCGMFNMQQYSYSWVILKLQSNGQLISDYKFGKLQTKAFLGKLLEDIFPFLKDVTYSYEVIEGVWQNRKNLISISDVSDNAILTSDLIALALLEQAWTARMQFSPETDNHVDHFFKKKGKNESVYLVTNGNEMDTKETIKYLKRTVPELPWLSDEQLDNALQVPHEALNEGIALTSDGHLKLYASYAHRASKTGHIHETNVTTANLLEKLIDQEKIDVTKTTLISQWKGDRDMAARLGIETIKDSKEYFPPAQQVAIKME